MVKLNIDAGYVADTGQTWGGQLPGTMMARYSSRCAEYWILACIMSRPAWFQYICDIKKLIKNFHNVKISCVGRKSNALAKYVRQKVNHVTIGTVPEKLLLLWKNECNWLLE